MTELDFLGHTLSENGIEPNFCKIEAIIEMPNPSNVKELQRFLGMINYLGKFIPNLSDETAPLRKLLEKNVQWTFDKPQIDAVEKLKHLVTSSPVLKYFDPNKPSKVSSDASKVGLGAVLEQQHPTGWHPIAFASRSLNPSEQNYCPLERETLSIVFACERFRDYVYGQHFEVCNDHQPLKPIFNNPIGKAPARIQRFMLRLQRYDFKLHYVKGKKMFVTDTLSRAALEDDDSEIPEDELNVYVNSVIKYMPISETRLREFRRETSADTSLRALAKQIKNGWPDHRDDVDHSIRPYFNFSHDLSLNNGMILKCNRIVVPASMQKDMVKVLHTGHPGISKIKSRARSSVYWPGIDSQLEDLVNACSLCQEERHKQPKEPLLPHDIPSRPWEKVGTDLFHLFNKSYVLVVDYNSKYFDLSQLPDAESRTVTEHTKAIFSRYGIPKEIISDNSPEFRGSAYKKFCKSWDIYHNPSSPEYPQSNGLVERTIQTVKRTIRKTVKSGEDVQLALLALKTTPLVGLKSPASMFFNRSPRTLLPSITDKCPSPSKPSKRSNPPTVASGNSQSSGKELPELRPGDKVRLRDGKTWSRKGRVVRKADQPRSYLVKSNGNILRRNRRHLLKTTERFDSDSDSSSSLISASKTQTRISDDLPPTASDDITSEDEVIGDKPYTTRSGRESNKPDRLTYSK